jgi:predicted nucleic acid-binding protein
MSVFFDSAVLVQLFDADAPARRQAVQARFEWHARAGDLVFSPQVLEEFYRAVTAEARPLLGAEPAAMVLADLAEFPSVPLDNGLVQAAAQRVRGDALGFREAMLVESALRAGAAVLYSERLPAGRRFGSLVVENPFAGMA